MISKKLKKILQFNENANVYIDIGGIVADITGLKHHNGVIILEAKLSDLHPIEYYMNGEVKEVERAEGIQQ